MINNVLSIDEEERFWDNMDAQIVLWRKNIHRFISEYFGVTLAEFQKIILYEMSRDTPDLRQFIFWASRGIGKSFLTLLFALAQGVLYPGIKIVVSSPTVDQSNAMMGKFDEIKAMYPNIANEIDIFNKAKDGSTIRLKNGSVIYTVTCNNNARGRRCQILILDEFIGMDKTIIDDVLAKFLTEPRRPAYRSINKYAKHILGETNKKIYLSSINTSSEWSFEEFLGFNKMIERKDENYYTISIPYQFGVQGGMITEGYIKSEVNKPTTDINKFRSEMECIPLGEGDSSLFRYESLSSCRVNTEALYPMTDMEYIEYKQMNRTEISKSGFNDLDKCIIRSHKYYQPKLEGEVRLISADIANVGGKKNDDSAFIIYRLFPEKLVRMNPDTGNEDIETSYIKQVAYIETHNGMKIDDQVVRLKQLFYDLECDYIVLDTMSIGSGVFDICSKKTYDVIRNRFYPAWAPINGTDEMKGKVYDENAEEVLFSMKTAGRNSGRMHLEMATITTVALDRGKIKFLKTVAEAYDSLDAMYKYSFLKSNVEQRFNQEAKRLTEPFELTSTLILQAISVKKIENKASGGIQIKEAKSTDKKDILMSFLYGMYTINALERDLIYEEPEVDFSRYAFTTSSKNIAPSKFGGEFKGFGSGYSKFF